MACAVLKPLEVLLVVDHMWVVGLNLFNLLDQLGGPAALDFVVLWSISPTFYKQLLRQYSLNNVLHSQTVISR